MGCGASKEFTETELGSIDTPFAAAQCADGAAPASITIEVVCNSGMTGGTVISNGGATIAKGKVVSTFNKEGAFEDASGKRFAVSKTATKKLIPLHTETRLLVPTGSGEAEYASDDKEKASAMYKFAMVSAKHAMTTASGEYSLYTGSAALTPMLTARRLAGIKQQTIVSDMSGACVAKSRVSDRFGKQVTIEIAAGVDKFAVIALVSSLAPGGGGANAGSGTGAYGG